MRSKPTSSRTALLSPNGPIFSTRRPRVSSPSIRGSHSQLCARFSSSAARPVSVRRCHGDLHLRNIVLIDGEPTLFDVEFSDEIATGDVLYDLAFLLMDLEERGLRASANRLFNRYLAPEPPNAVTDLVALPLFLSLRAAIRAKVEAAPALSASIAKSATKRARLPADTSIARSGF